VTSDIHRVVSYLGPDQITEGFYTFDGSTVTMMCDDGKGNWSPMTLGDTPVTETVAPEHVEAVAKKLTRRIRKAFRGEIVEGFGRRLTYENEAFV
jgi:hypothetical protein